MIVHRYLTILDPLSNSNVDLQKEKGFIGKETEDAQPMKKFFDVVSPVWWKRMMKRK